MTLSLVGIEVEAFKNFVARTEVQLDNLPPGLYFVRGRNLTNGRLGSNGSGKSTLFSDAVAWCLWGRTTGKLRTTDVRSWLTKKSPRVAITFRNGDRELVVQRGPRATELTIDGTAVGQEDVDALLTGFDAGRQAIIWGQGQPLFLDLAPRDKMALLSDALGLERWDRRAEAAGARAKRLEASLSALDGELDGLEAAREHAETALAEAKAAADTWGRDHNTRLEEMQEALKQAEKHAREAEERRGETSLAQDEAGTRLKTLRPDVEAWRAELTALDEQEAAARRRQEDLGKEKTRLEADLAAFREEGVCPTCGQPVTEDSADQHVSTLSERLKEVAGEMRTARAEAKKAAGAADNLLTSRLERGEEDLKTLEEAYDRLTTELRGLDRRAGETRLLASTAADRLREAEGETNPHRDAAASARRRLKEIDASVREKDAHGDKLEASLERARFWAKGFREVRLQLVDDVLADLRDTTADVMDALGLGEWEVDYTTEKETASGTTQRALVASVRSPEAPEGVRWECYSGGEAQRLRLAAALALGEVLLAHAGTTTDFRVLDEPTRGLSAEGVEDLCEMLADYAREAEVRLFLMDHMAVESSAFASTITVENREDGARLIT